MLDILVFTLLGVMSVTGIALILCWLSLIIGEVLFNE